MKLLLLIFAVAIPINAQKIRYDNYTLFKITPENKQQYEFLRELHKKNEYDFWNLPSENVDWVNVVSSPELRAKLIDLLGENGIPSEVTMENIQEAFDRQQPQRHKRDTSKALYWTNYQLLEEIYEWFDDLATNHPSVVTVIEVGQSYEGRTIKGVRISRNSGRRAFFLEGGMIGADWLSPVTLTYVVNQLVNSVDSETRQASLDYDWYIVPVSNPDGYEYSQDLVRLWTKNRRPLGNGNFGVDLTKNWNSYWSVNGASFDPASSVYAGPGPFSEVETRSLSEFISTIPRLYGFLSFRATMQRLVVPFSHTIDHMYNYNEMMLVGRRAMGSLAVRYGTIYTVGNSQEVFDGATGNIVDWVKHRMNPPIAATFQMRDETSGYTIPVARIQPNCEEVFDAILAVVREGAAANLGN